MIAGANLDIAICIGFRIVRRVEKQIIAECGIDKGVVAKQETAAACGS